MSACLSTLVADVTLNTKETLVETADSANSAIQKSKEQVIGPGILLFPNIKFKKSSILKPVRYLGVKCDTKDFPPCIY